MAMMGIEATPRTFFVFPLLSSSSFSLSLSPLIGRMLTLIVGGFALIL
jgi:hypothetical protein